MKKLFKKNFFGILLFTMILSSLIWKEKTEKSDIKKNKETSIAEITSEGIKSQVNYIFRFNGEWISGSDSGNGKVKVGEVYPVDFDKTNPENSYILTERSINPMAMVNQGVEIEGVVERIGYSSDSYVDLYISYVYEKETFKFRTRKHIDSLSCGKVSDCKNAVIKLKVSGNFPELNNLYFESYDRSKLRRELKLKFE